MKLKTQKTTQLQQASKDTKFAETECIKFSEIECIKINLFKINILAAWLENCSFITTLMHQ